MLTIEGLLKAIIKLLLKLMILRLHKQYAPTPLKSMERFSIEHRTGPGYSKVGQLYPPDKSLSTDRVLGFVVSLIKWILIFPGDSDLSSA